MEGFLNVREVKKYSVIRAVVKGQMTQEQAQEHLNLCRDSIWRLKKVYLQQGPAGFAHGLRGKPSNRDGDSKLRHELIELYCREYAVHRYGIRHFLDEVGTRLSKQVPYSTAWRWLRQSGAVQRKRRSKAHRARRPRKECFGELVQMDTSIHDWTRTGKKYCLISAMDDATGRVLGARFFEQDTTLGNMAVMRDIFEKYGLPIAFYVDRSPIFKVTRTGEGGVYHKKFIRSGTTQVQRALDELGIELIYAYSPQAKGRIERSYGTWQDRLVSEFSKNDIVKLEDCNAYVQSCFLPKFNHRFSKETKKFPNAFVSLRNAKLDFYLAEKYHRIVTNDHIVSCKQGNLVACIKPDNYRQSYARAQVQVYRHIDYSHSIFYNDRKLKFEYLSSGKNNV